MSAVAIELSRLRRAVAAERIRTGGRRSVLPAVVLPGAILLPTAVTAVVATVSEHFSQVSSDVEVVSVATTNSVYWILTFTVTVWCCAAAYTQTTAERGDIGDLGRILYPRPWTALAARWIFYGVGAAVSAVALAALTMIMLPAFYPNVYGAVDLVSADGLRFVLTIPVYAVSAVGISLGVAAVIGNPAASVAVLLGWVYIVENTIALIPHGYSIQGYMPFLNGVYGTGQEIVVMPPWGINGALAYCAAVSVVLFTIACCAAYLGRR
ncbi:ABC transporter permease [Gordonia amarae]|uniref:ABC transporter permease protein n=2 Tax=Gordonia amarae TaxID=36821 RepID=G7GNB4_9ACTN|nr:ABC transporter permease [Gordonia amarae]QHN20492.1 ABC transporter permease [Gordonia amarae]QHN29344.1 ABC transporter permease [Gordonia amarae]QHN38123.1 ABC transporter permease [Gordonia amarae]GAB05089.1 hypothetical protein GOAMR_26_00630 [Gordonia amarae NBRC 15530]